MRRARPEAATPVEIDLTVEAGDWPAAAALEELASRAVAAAVEKTRPPLAPGSELSLLFTDDRHIRALNRRYRQKDAATNVLSFPGAPPGGPLGRLLGDIVLARETIGREARREGLTLEHHLSHLIVHGFLHLLGHDHEEEEAAGRMEGIETAILAGLGIADPYVERDD